MSTEKKSYPGSCHCKAITYTINVALPEPPQATRCNCSICHKMGVVMLNVAESDFNLLTPASKSDPQIGDYVWRNKDAHRFFCKTCGVQIWSSGAYEHEGNKIQFFIINVLTLEPSDDVDLTKWKLKYFNGAQDAWNDGTRDTPHKGGCV